MTAIAEIVGEPPTGSREAACETSLAALTLYGSRKSTAATGMAAFGANLRMILPEDRFDRQPYRNEQFLLVADVRLDNREELLAALGEQAPNSTQCAERSIPRLVQMATRVDRPHRRRLCNRGPRQPRQ